MRIRALLFAVTVPVVVSAAALWLAGRSDRRVRGKMPARSSWASRLTRPGPSNGSRVAPAPLRVDRVVSEKGGDPMHLVRLRPGQVLARVNGTAIGIKDLVPDGPRGERIMDPDLFRFLLERAIDREIIFQTAEAQNVTLTAEQEAQLAQMRASPAAEPGLVKELTRNPEQLEFDLRDTAGLMLQAQLLANLGASPHVTPEMVREYYEENGTDFEPLPGEPAARKAAWQSIEREIRQSLTLETQVTYQEAERLYLDQLRAGAEITL